MTLNTVGTDYAARHAAPPGPVDVETPLDWSGRLSIDLIRQHTKTDDIPGVTDELLNTYRAAAVEAAERYTGLLLAMQKSITEPIQAPHGMHPHGYHGSYSHGSLFYEPRSYKPTYKFRLKYPTADGIIHIYGGRYPGDNTSFYVPPNTRTIRVPIRYGMVDFSNCCDPCSPAQHLNGGLMALYTAGFTCANEVPSAVVLGCLQYVAWIIQHPGDEILTVRNRRDARSEGAQGTNNIAIASGALETWRIIDDDIV